MNTKNLLDLSLLLALLLISSTTAAQLKKNQLKTTSLSEDNARAIMMKFQPIAYLNSDEEYFPIYISDLPVDWSKVTFYDKNTYLNFTYKGPSEFDHTVPMLVSMYENSDGTLRISYIFFYAYNGCGPKGSYDAGVGPLKESGTVNLCPADLHYGDIEHISMNLNSGYNSIKNITYAYHQWSKTYTSDGSGDGAMSKYVTFSGTHPLVYIASGSHASYSTLGDQDYDKLLDKSGSILGVSYKASLYFTDYPPSSTTGAYKWTGNARLLKLNGNPTSDITPVEMNLAFKFYGAIGPTTSNKVAGVLVDFLDDVEKAAKDLDLTSLKNDAESASTELAALYEATGVSALATGRSWW